MSESLRDRGERASQGDQTEARSHLRAAFAILRSPTAEPHHALVHLERCCAALLQEAEPGEAVPGRLREIRARLAFWESVDSPAALPKRRELLAQAQELAGLLRVRRAPARRAAWLWAAAALAAMALAIGTLLIRQPMPSARPWQARYYPSEDFSGRPLTRDEPDVSHQWGAGPPLPELPRDRFSARWDSCLVLDHALTIPWQVVAQGAARLHVDGRPVLELTDDGTLRSRGEAVTLDRGEHHLHVEYSSGAGDAGIALLASLDGEPPAPLPARWLRSPRSDGAAACALTMPAD